VVAVGVSKGEEVGGIHVVIEGSKRGLWFWMWSCKNVGWKLKLRLWKNGGKHEENT